jgi:hypothetical protein
LNFKSKFWTSSKIEIWILIQRFNSNKFEFIALESFQKYRLLDLQPMDFNFKPKDLNSNKGDFETRFLRCKERFKSFLDDFKRTKNKFQNIKIISIKFILNEKMKSFSKFEFLLKKCSHSEIEILRCDKLPP